MDLTTFLRNFSVVHKHIHTEILIFRPFPLWIIFICRGFFGFQISELLNSFSLSARSLSLSLSLTLILPLQSYKDSYFIWFLFAVWTCINLFCFIGDVWLGTRIWCLNFMFEPSVLVSSALSLSPHAFLPYANLGWRIASAITNIQNLLIFWSKLIISWFCVWCRLGHKINLAADFHESRIFINTIAKNSVQVLFRHGDMCIR